MTSIIDIVLYHHLGLGDHLTCNGLVHALTEKYRTIYLVCKEKNQKTVRHLYHDFNNIIVVPISKEPDSIVDFSQKIDTPILKIGFEHVDPLKFERSFYDQVSVPFEAKDSKFIFPKDMTGSKTLYDKVVNQIGKNYAFIHDESSSGKYSLKIETPLPEFRVKMTDTDDILDYVELICNASEIHVINSGVYHLIPPLLKQGKIKTDRIFYHNCRPFHMGGIPLELPPGIRTVEYIAL